MRASASLPEIALGWVAPSVTESGPGAHARFRLLATFHARHPGIELAVRLKKAGLAYAQVDAGQIGSTISWYAPGTHFFSSPERIALAGVPLQTLEDVLRQMFGANKKNGAAAEASAS